MSNQFVGTWRLISWESRDADGNVYPLQDEGSYGYIMYTEDGYMSATLVKGNRKNFASPDIQAGTPEELAEAAKTYIAYVGKYEIETDKVIHKLEASLFPNWVGTNQERFFEFKENQLILSTPPFLLQGKEQTAYLIWEKI